MYFARLLIFTFILFAGAGAAIAQVSPFPTPRPDRRSSDPFGKDEDVDRIADALNKQAEVEKAAKVPKAFKERHRLFLKTPDTGIFKIFPAESTNVLDANSNNKRIPSEGAFYSFGEKLHSRQYADLRFSGGSLRAGSVTDSYGAFQPMGDVSLDKITAEIPEAAAMLKPRLPKKRKLVAELMDSAPTEADIIPGKTYLLRTAHSGKQDQLIAFQIVEKDKDNGVIIIWKRLYKSKAPEFKD